MIYKLQLSNTKDTIPLTEEEFKKFKDNVGANFIEFASGLINPSFVVSITIDTEASREEMKQLARQRTTTEIAAPREAGTQKMADVLALHRPEYLLGEN